MFKNFKGSHPLVFDFAAEPKKPILADTQIGDVFLRQGAVCMRVQERRNAALVANSRDIINLQTGAVWAASEDDEIEMVRACLTVA